MLEEWIEESAIAKQGVGRENNEGYDEVGQGNDAGVYEERGKDADIAVDGQQVAI